MFMSYIGMHNKNHILVVILLLQGTTVCSAVHFDSITSASYQLELSEGKVFSVLPGPE